MKRLMLMILVVSVQSVCALEYTQDERQLVAAALAAGYCTLTQSSQVKQIEVEQQQDQCVIVPDAEQPKSQKEDWASWGRALALEMREVFRELSGF
jgi:hypothetical protein